MIVFGKHTINDDVKNWDYNKLKEVFGKSIKVDLLMQDRENNQRSYKANIKKIDNHLFEKYTPATLEILLSTS